MKNKTQPILLDEKPLNDIVDDIVHDITTAINWWYKSNKTFDDLMVMFEQMRCKNTIHGLQIAKKMYQMNMVNGMCTLDDDLLFAVILHDVVKYKKRDDVVQAICDKYIGQGRWVSSQDHGIDGGMVLSYILPNVDKSKFHFVYMHAKNKPFRTNSDNWNSYELQFFVMDDLIRDVKKYKRKTSKDQYEIIRNYFEKPSVKDTVRIFTMLQDINQHK